MNYNTNELYHHGVAGMKWGKRNGPPYPLNAEGKASLAKQKKTSGNAGSGFSDLSSKKKLDLSKWFTIPIASQQFYQQLVLGEQLLSQQQFQNFMNTSIQNAQIANYMFSGMYYGSKLPFKKKTKILTDYDDVKYVNPLKYRDNCVCCSIAYELRRRGYDVTANNTTEYERAIVSLKECFPDCEPKIVDPVKLLNDNSFNDNGTLSLKDPYSASTKKKLEILNQLASTNSNITFREDLKLKLSAEKSSRGVCLLEWAEGHYGHCINYIVDDKGRITLIDGQSNSIYIGNDINYILDSARIGAYIRLDNSSINADSIKGACNKYGKQNN